MAIIKVEYSSGIYVKTDVNGKNYSSANMWYDINCDKKKLVA